MQNGRGRRAGSALGVLALVAAAALTACGDDAPDPISEDAYRTSAQELCDQHGSVIDEEREQLLESPTSDAEIVSFYRAEFVPRMKAIVRSLNNGGFPPEHAAQYATAVNDAFGALNNIEANTISLIDRARAELLLDDENPFLDLEAAVEALDLPCGTGKLPT